MAEDHVIEVPPRIPGISGMNAVVAALRYGGNMWIWGYYATVPGSTVSGLTARHPTRPCRSS